MINIVAYESLLPDSVQSCILLVVLCGLYDFSINFFSVLHLPVGLLELTYINIPSRLRQDIQMLPFAFRHLEFKRDF